MTEKEYKEFEGKNVRIDGVAGIVCGYSLAVGDVHPLLVAFLESNHVSLFLRKDIPQCFVIESNEDSPYGYSCISKNSFYISVSIPIADSGRDLSTADRSKKKNSSQMPVGDTIPIADYMAGIDRWVGAPAEDVKARVDMLNSMQETSEQLPEEKNPAHFFIDCQVYPFDVLISYGESGEELAKVLVDECGVSDSEISELLDDLEFSGRAVTHMREDGSTIIRFRTPGDVCIFMGTVAHECMHASSMILDRCGFKYKFGTSDEAYAYLTGYLTEKTVEGLIGIGKLNVTV